ncbi:MAG: hypothetical protein HOE53_02140, partial [Candidatus Magasanikbacteria bacterium]|nr:hypothetical protein [Candidatus Magasanikbacteria bacterium]
EAGADRARIYIDGVDTSAALSGTIPVTMIADANPVQIGKAINDAPHNALNGYVDEFAIFDNVLTSAEVAEMYARQRYVAAAGFTSRIYDGGDTIDWDSLKWVTDRPTAKELPDSMATETAYSNGNFGMGYNVGVWHLNESSWDGTADEVVDGSGNANHGVRSGNATTASDGRFERAGTFDGTGDYVDVADSASLSVTDAITLSAWIKTSVQNKGILSKGIFNATSNGDYSLYLDNANSGAPGCHFNNGAGTALDTTGISDNIWHHVVCTYDKDAGGSDEIKLYVDGVLVATGDYSTAINDSSEALHIGGYYSSSYVFNGLIDEVAVSSNAWTAGTVQDAYRRGENRLKIQVRSCNDAACSGETFQGPDGTTSTFYTASTDSVLGTASTTLTNVSNNQYMQYQTFFETSSSTYDVELASVTIAGSVVVPGEGPVVWDGGGVGSDWCTDGNWDGDTVPTSVSDVTIDTAGTMTTDGCADGDIDFSTLTIGTTNAAILELTPLIGTGGSITIANNGTLTQNTSSTQTISGTLTVEGGATGGTLTHTANVADQLYEIDIQAQNIDIQAGGTVDVDYKGYTSENGPGTAAQVSWGSGASHGGNGGIGNGGSVPGDGYCNITNVATIGSGGGPSGANIGGAGGGLIRLSATSTITINGTLTADGKTAGNTYGGGGSGGGINLIADTFAGTPTSFTANAGNGSHPSGSAGGGGGCVALTYTTANAIAASSITAYGGTVYAVGAPGTIYISGDSSSLTVSNGSTPTRSTIITQNISVDSLTLSKASTTFSNVTSTVSLAMSNTSMLFVTSSGYLDLPLGTSGSFGGSDSIWVKGNANIVGISHLDGVTVTVVDGSTLTASSTQAIGLTGVLTLGETSTLAGITTLTTSGTINIYNGYESLTDVTVADGTMTVYGYTTSSPWTLTSLYSVGGTLSHGQNDTTQEHTLSITAASSTIASGGTLSADGVGYAGGYGGGLVDGFGPGGGTGGTYGGGGAHGGDGGAGSGNFAGGTAYCSAQPVYSMGSGSGEGNGGSVAGADGGGLVFLNITNILTINGTITSDGAAGNTYQGGGGGGGIYLVADTLSGSPTSLTATGGSSNGFNLSGGGGGGCAGVTWTTASSIDATDINVNAGSGWAGGTLPEVGFEEAAQGNQPPTATALTPAQGSANFVTVTTTIADPDSDVSVMAVQYSVDNAVWNNATIGAVTTAAEGDGVVTSSGYISDIDTDNDGSIDLTFSWNMGADLANTDDTSLYFRVTPGDTETTGTVKTSAAFGGDTKDPTAPGALSVASTSTDSMIFTLGATTTDSNFAEYKVFYKAGSSGVTTGDSSLTSSTDANLGNILFSSATTTTLPSLATNTQYVANMWAFDSYSRSASTTGEITFYTAAAVPTTTASTADSASQITVTWGANGNPSTTEYYVVDVSNGTRNSGWIVATTTSFTSLSAETSYSFKVKARNGNNIETAYDNAAAATTEAAPVSSESEDDSSSDEAIGGGGTISLPPPTVVIPPMNLDIDIGDDDEEEFVTLDFSESVEEAEEEAAGAPSSDSVDSVESEDDSIDIDEEEEDVSLDPVVLGVDAARVRVRLSLEDGTNELRYFTPQSEEYRVVFNDIEKGVAYFTVYPRETRFTLIQEEEIVLDVEEDGVTDLHAHARLVNEEFGVVDVDVTALHNVTMAINDGVRASHRRDVLLRVNHIPQLRLVAISENADFADAVFEGYESYMPYTLSAGEGRKKVYVKLRTEDGAEFTGSDSVYLTNRAANASDADCPVAKNKPYKHANHSIVYYVTDQCTKRPFASADAYFSYYYTYNAISVIPVEKLIDIPTDFRGVMPLGLRYKPAPGTLIKAEGSSDIYVVASGRVKHLIASRSVLQKLGYKEKHAAIVDPRLLFRYVDGEEITKANTHVPGTLIRYEHEPKVYVLELQDDGELVQRHIADEATFAALGYSWDKVIELNAKAYKEGDPVSIQ